MARAQQIKKELKKLDGCKLGTKYAFVKGCIWAENTLIKRACTWLKTNYEDIGIRWMRGDKAEDFVQQFKKAMEQ